MHVLEFLHCLLFYAAPYRAEFRPWRAQGTHPLGATTPGFDKIFVLVTFDIVVRCGVVDGGLEGVVAQFHLKSGVQPGERSGGMPTSEIFFMK